MINYKTEHAFQKDVYLHVNKYYPRLRRLLWATPNGDLRNQVTANKLKIEGVLPGVPDMILAIDGKVFFFELKKSPKEYLNKAQKIQIPLLREEGFSVYVIKGDFRAFIYALDLSLHQTNLKGLQIMPETIHYMDLTREEWEFDTKVFHYLFDMEEGRVKIDTLAKPENRQKFINAVAKFSGYRLDVANGFKIDFTTSRPNLDQEHVRKILSPILDKNEES